MATTGNKLLFVNDWSEFVFRVLLGILTKMTRYRLLAFFLSYWDS
jgi:hypothetical protein